MSEFTPWARAYEQALHDQHERLVKVARIRQRAVNAGTTCAVLAALAAGAAFLMPATWARALQAVCAIALAACAAAHQALVWRIDRDLAAADLTIEFSYAVADLDRDTPLGR